MPELPDKLYYSISEVAKQTGVKPHVLRYWEQEFPSLKPKKNRAGNRVYRSKEIQVVLLVKQLLYEEKYTIEGANKKLVSMRREGGLEEARREVVNPHFLEGLKMELEELRKILTPPARAG